MTRIFGETVTLGQENGPDVELVVFGDEHYARYETPSGYSAIYDRDLGLFVYASLHEGSFVSTGVPIAEPPPAGAVLHGEESAEARQAKLAARQQEGSGPTPDGEEAP